MAAMHPGHSMAGQQDNTHAPLAQAAQVRASSLSRVQVIDPEDSICMLRRRIVQIGLSCSPRRFAA
jgi:hypothetical protein